MHDRFRTTLASAALIASLSVAGVASANGGSGHEPGHGKGKGKTKVCKKKHGKGYLVHGFYVGGDLTQVAGADTARWGDDRWSGTVIVEVTKGNKRGRRDVGLSSYAVKDVRVVGAKDGVVPDEGTRLQLIGKQNAGCAPAPTTPTTPPTTPEPTTPTTPEPTATLSEYSSEEEPAREHPAEPTENEATEPEEPKGKHGKDKHGDHEHGADKGKDHHDGYDDEYDDEDYDDEADETTVDEPTPVTDVTIRVVHFKLR